MASKDQAIGALIFIVCLVVAIGYLIAMFLPNMVADWLSTFTTASPTGVRYWLVAIPVLVAFVAVLAIGAWIGWTMATTPPPKPLEEIEAEEKKEEEEKPEPTEEVKTEEKKKKK